MDLLVGNVPDTRHIPMRLLAHHDIAIPDCPLSAAQFNSSI